MQKYQHKQQGTALLIIMLLCTCMLIIATYDMVSVMNLSLALLAVISVLFSSLTVYVNDTYIGWHFGIKFWHKKLLLSEISSAKIIQTKWYYGLGIRLIPSGWLYIVSGNQAIEITKTNGDIVSIGTNDVNALLRVLSSRGIDT